MDVQLVEKIVHEVKSQGVFDMFRKDSMADVDTKPAYQNLRQRVENTVKRFLSEQKWTPETNKNQLREKLRRHITESGFLDVGVERIVDQVVNPKIGSVFQPRIEEIAYNYLGLPPPPKTYEPPPPPLMHPLPPLPLGAPPPPLNVEACSLLPNDLEQVSPDSDKVTIKSEVEGDDQTEVDMETDEKIMEDEDESPPFEPLIKSESDIEAKHEATKIKAEVDESTLGENTIKKDNETSDMAIKVEVKENNDSQGSNNFPSATVDKEVSQSMDCRNSQDSQLSSVSSDTGLSPVTNDDSILRSSQEEAVTANISEEAQMPKFNENSSEPNGINGNKEVDSALHFDIKKDEIKFEGTERKSKVEDTHESPPPDELKCPLSTESATVENKNDPFKYASNNNSNIEQREYDLARTPNAGPELSFGSSIEDSTSIPTNTTTLAIAEEKEKEQSTEEKSHPVSTPKQQQTSTPTPTPTGTPTATPTPPPPLTQTPTATPSPVSTQKPEKDYHITRHSSSTSSTKHKKYSKERRRSHDREREKDRYRSSKDSKVNRHHSSNTASGNKSNNSKHSTSSSKYSSSHHKSSHEKDLEKSSSSHSSSKQTKHSSSDKRNHSSSSSHRDHSSSSSNTSSKRTDQRKDDHHEAKPKPLRRKSTDSNDDDGDKGTGGGSKSNSQHNNRSNTSNSRHKSKSDVNQSPPSKNNDSQKESPENYDKLQLNNNVVLLSDLLENPHTQFIDLDTQGHLIGAPMPTTPVNMPPSGISSCIENHINSNGDQCAELLFFDDKHTTFVDRLNLLNDIMTLCRSAVNSLRFDPSVEEGFKESHEEGFNHIGSASLSSLSDSLKRNSNIEYEDFEKTPRKRCKLSKSEENVLKTSPTPSDISVSSKENDEIDKNTDLSKKLDRHKAAIQKLSQQQRYSSDDLYKPRPILGQRSRRRGMDSIV